MSETLDTETVLQHLLECSPVAQRLRVEGQCRGTSDLREIVAMTLDFSSDDATQLITQLTEALAEVTRDLDEMVSTVSRAVSQCEANATVMVPASTESIRRAREALAVAKERAL